MEAAGQTSFTLGQVFDIWGQPLSTSNIAGHGGPVQAYTASSPGVYMLYNGDLRSLQLQPHQEIVLEVGPSFVGPQLLPRIIFPNGL